MVCPYLTQSWGEATQHCLECIVYFSPCYCAKQIT